MLQTVKERLAFMGYTVSAADETALIFLIGKTDDHIKNYCNIDKVPRELKRTEADMIALEFLNTKAASGGLGDTSINLERVTQISEGDTSVSYANDSAGSLSSVYEEMKRKFESDLLPFRSFPLSTWCSALRSQAITSCRIRSCFIVRCCGTSTRSV